MMSDKPSVIAALSAVMAEVQAVGKGDRNNEQVAKERAWLDEGYWRREPDPRDVNGFRFYAGDFS